MCLTEMKLDYSDSVFPNKTAVFKREESRCGKHNNLRVTVHLATNQSGKEKLHLLVIGDKNKSS